MRSLLLLSLALAACARGSMQDQPALVDAATDAPGADGPTPMIDAPSQMGTCTMTFAGSLAKWDLTGETGSQATSMPDMQAPGVTAGVLSRAAGLTAVSGANSINSSGWPTAAQMDPTKYYAFTLSPPAGCELVVNQVTIDALKSGTGPAMGALATSVDAYATTKSVATGGGLVTVMPMVSSTTMIELRVYGWAASSTGGTLRIQNTLTVDGSLR